MNGQVDAGDVYLAQAYLLGTQLLTFEQIAHGDVYPSDGDGQLTASDLIIIVRNALGY